MTKKTLFRFLAIVVLTTNLKAQMILSRQWIGSGGTMAVFHRNVTKTDALGYVYTAGSTLNGNGDYDIILQKFSATGTLQWKKTFNGAANMHDMAADIFIDNNNDVYVTGGSIQSAPDSMDLVVLKYLSDSTFQWATYYNNGAFPMPHDAGTAIVCDNIGGVYVTGGSFGSSTMADYVTIKLNAASGATIWAQRYDYAGLHDVASRIEFSGGQAVVTGGSQSSALPNVWDLATLSYDAFSGALLASIRTSGTGTVGVEEVFDLAKDTAGNVYITGTAINLVTGNDISIYKLDSNLVLKWQRHFDGYNGEDKGYGVKVDSQGNVYAVGYVSTGAEGKNIALVKYDSTGVLKWSREYSGLANLDDWGVQLVIDANDRIFVTGAVTNKLKTDFVTIGYMPDGQIIGQAIFDGPDGLDDRPEALAIDGNGDLIVVGQSKDISGTLNTVTVKYGVFDRPYSPVLVNGVEAYNNNEILIRFDTSVINKSAINRREFKAGKLKDFITLPTQTLMTQKLGFDVSNAETYKIFDMTLADTLSVTRLGDVIKVPTFWSTLAVFLHSNDMMETIDSLNKLKQIIKYAEPDYFGHFDGVPNDSLYLTQQKGLQSAKGGIRVDSAWTRQVGQPYVRVGIFDTGINWRHQDFGNGTWPGTKANEGWNYYYNADPKNQANPDINGHGTACAGIAGALRNNVRGGSGISGGDVQNGNTGCKLVSMGIPSNVNFNPGPSILHSQAANAITEGAANYTIAGGVPAKAYTLHVQNHSWGSAYTTKLLRNAVNFCYRNNCFFVASSGNDVKDSIKYPACYKDEWVMKVGANDTSGTRYVSSNYGYSLDVIAPGSSAMFAAPDCTSNVTYAYNQNFQVTTSMAAPHVAGVTALVLSEHNPQTSVAYPNKLAPEDVQNMIRRTATPVTKDIPKALAGLPVPNAYAGYGRLNADSALRMTSLPYRIRHYAQTVSLAGATLQASNQNVIYPEGIPINATVTGINLLTDIYKITVIVNHSIPPTETYLGAWVRNSSCDLYGLTNTIMLDHWSDVVMNNCSPTAATLTGYFYKTKGYAGGFNVYTEWQPKDTSQTAKFEYSIYTYDTAPDVGLKEKAVARQNDFTIHPNPALNILNVAYCLPGGENAIIEIYDISGRRMSALQIDRCTGENLTSEVDISRLPSGLYFCRYSSESAKLTKRFIKE